MASNPTTLTKQDLSRIILVVLGLAFLAGALVSPWWTRGVTLHSVCGGRSSSACDSDAQRPPAIEGEYLNYAPFRTPGEVVGFTSDASRASAVSVLGIALVVAAAFAVLHVAARIAMRQGWVTLDHDVVVRLAIAAFMAGAFAVLWGALFLPLLGTGPGMMWGTEYGSANFSGGQTTVTRYANAGFFLAIIGAVGFPAYLWVDASVERSQSRLRTQLGATSSKTTRGGVGA